METTGQTPKFSWKELDLSGVKIYQVFDNSTLALSTQDELKALRLLRKLCEKHDVTWAWVDEAVLQ